MGLPVNAIAVKPGGGGSIQSQAAQDQNNQRASMVALKAATSGGGIAVGGLPSGFGGPANAEMQKTFIAATKTSNQAGADSVYDNQAKTGGKTRSKKTRRRRHWSAKYKKSINCKRPKGFSQRQHCKYGRKGTKRSKL